MEGASRGPFLCHLSCLLLLLQLCTWGSADKFQVIGPTDPVVAVLGGNAILSCSLCPAMNAENMELRWFRSKFSEAVLIYQNQQEQKEGQMPQYRGRTSLVRDFLTQGEAAVLIDNVRASDSGVYTCFFKKGDFYEQATLELKVTGVGSAPEVLLEGLQEDGVRVACKASGWFPKPQVQWRHPSGEKLLAFSEDHVQDADGLFHVEASLVVRDSSARNVICSILNPILGQEKMKAISIPENFFPEASPWKAAFATILSLLVLLVFGAGYFLKEERSAKLQVLKARDELQAELDWRKAVYQAAWKKTHLDVDLLKKHFKAWPVTVDPHSAYCKTALSQENMSLTSKRIHVSSLNDDTCSVLGCEAITSGRCYWEVEVGNGEKGIWALGVCREDVNRTNNIRESPENGFWVVKWCISEFYTFTSSWLQIAVKQFPSRVGVFLDCDDRKVSFYNLTDGSHIFSFSPVSFTGTLLPYFMVGSENLSLSICSDTGEH